jgi:hypothetical protein
MKCESCREYFESNEDIAGECHTFDTIALGFELCEHHRHVSGRSLVGLDESSDVAERKLKISPNGRPWPRPVPAKDLVRSIWDHRGPTDRL